MASNKAKFNEEELDLLLELLDMHIDNSRDYDNDDYNEQVRIVNGICKKLTSVKDTYEFVYDDEEEED